MECLKAKLDAHKEAKNPGDEISKRQIYKRRNVQEAMLSIVVVRKSKRRNVQEAMLSIVVDRKSKQRNVQEAMLSIVVDKYPRGEMSRRQCFLTDRTFKR